MSHHRNLCGPWGGCNKCMVCTGCVRTGLSIMGHGCVRQAYQAHAAPKGGLGQGMGAVAAFLLVVMGPTREEDAFWTLLALTHDRVPPTCVAEVGLG